MKKKIEGFTFVFARKPDFFFLTCEKFVILKSVSSEAAEKKRKKMFSPWFSHEFNYISVHYHTLIVCVCVCLLKGGWIKQHRICHGDICVPWRSSRGPPHLCNLQLTALTPSSASLSCPPHTHHVCREGEGCKDTREQGKKIKKGGMRWRRREAVKTGGKVQRGGREDDKYKSVYFFIFFIFRKYEIIWLNFHRGVKKAMTSSLTGLISNSSFCHIFQKSIVV